MRVRSSSRPVSELACHPSCLQNVGSIVDDRGAKMPQRNRKYWSSDITQHSDALSLENGVFAKSDPRAIARSLKASAEQSRRRKAPPFQSAMSMLNFFINRGGNRITADRRRTLEQAKRELRRLFGRNESGNESVAASRPKGVRNSRAGSSDARSGGTTGKTTKRGVVSKSAGARRRSVVKAAVPVRDAAAASKR